MGPAVPMLLKQEDARSCLGTAELVGGRRRAARGATGRGRGQHAAARTLSGGLGPWGGRPLALRGARPLGRGVARLRRGDDKPTSLISLSRQPRSGRGGRRHQADISVEQARGAYFTTQGLPFRTACQHLICVFGRCRLVVVRTLWRLLDSLRGFPPSHSHTTSVY